MIGTLVGHEGELGGYSLYYFLPSPNEINKKDALYPALFSSLFDLKSGKITR
jgi:hypothetical protein